MTDQKHEVVVLGAGVSGIYQIKCLTDLGMDAILLEADEDLGGTWYRNRYPGARFDSESYTYGYSFSKELLDEWHWKERFSSQPENLKYLNFVADKFNLRRHMRFNARVETMAWDERERRWQLRLANGETYTARFVVSGIGPRDAQIVANGSVEQETLLRHHHDAIAQRRHRGITQIHSPERHLSAGGVVQPRHQLGDS